MASKQEKKQTRKKTFGILISVIAAYIATELVALVYKYGNYKPETLLFPVIFLLTLIYINTYNK